MPDDFRNGAVRVAYFLRVPNVGDLVNPALVTALTERAVSHTSNHDMPHLLAIGSLMAGARPASEVWGTGVMHPSLGIGNVAADKVHALRGRLTYAAMRQGGVPVGDVPLGDPGFLVPALLGIKRSDAPRFRIGLACHYVDRHHPALRYMMKGPEVIDLNVHEPPEIFIEKMSNCETVISSSLHGLVFAESLGIPNLWIKAGGDIAGDGFKFHDWFSTTRRPQATPYALTTHDTVKDLIARAEPHESTVDVHALEAAFPRERLPELQRPSEPRTLSVPVCRRRPTPVFLISFNRGGMLKRAIAGIDQLARPTHVVVHDNGSTEPETLDILEEIENSGIQVFRYPPITAPDGLNNVNDTVQAYFSAWGEPQRYVVSDCDIDMSVTDPEALGLYDELLNRFRAVECVGPMLRIRDIPLTYPLFNRVMNRHIEQFWKNSPTILDTAFGQAAVLAAPIDTTFALHRAGEPFRRLKSGLRVYEPFEARHLDWYITDDECNRVYADTSSPDISHWNNRGELARYREMPLEHVEFIVVKRNEAGALELCKKQVLNRTPAILASSRPAAPGPIVSFSSASAAERAERIAHTQALQSARLSDVARWAQLAFHHADWASRGVALAQLVRPGESVFEFGAGRFAGAKALPAGCRYTASDVAPVSDGCVFYDLNAPTLTAISEHDVALFSGVLEYVHDLARTAEFLAAHFEAVVCSYAELASGSIEEIERRRYSGWFTDLTGPGFIALFEAAGFVLTKRANWGAQALFRFDRPLPAAGDGH